MVSASVSLQEVEEQVGLRGARPEVDVGDEESAVLDHAHPFELQGSLGSIGLQ